MLKTNCKKVREKVREYIRANYEGENYDDAPATDSEFGAVCSFIWACYYDEVGQYNRGNIQEDFCEWLCGLPSVLTLPHIYRDSAVDMVGEWLEETESEKARFNEMQACHLINYLVFSEVSKNAKR